MTVVPSVPMVSLVSVAVTVKCFGDSSACSASGVLLDGHQIQCRFLGHQYTS